MLQILWYSIIPGIRVHALHITTNCPNNFGDATSTIAAKKEGRSPQRLTRVVAHSTVPRYPIWKSQSSNTCPVVPNHPLYRLDFLGFGQPGERDATAVDRLSYILHQKCRFRSFTMGAWVFQEDPSFAEWMSTIITDIKRFKRILLQSYNLRKPLKPSIFMKSSTVKFCK